MNEQLRSSGEAWPPLPLPRDGQGRSGTLAAPVSEDLSRFGDWLSQAIPLAAHMGLVEMQWSEPERSTGQLSWHLHLPPNLNDKGTAFGGAMSLEATLCGLELGDAVAACSRYPARSRGVASQSAVSGPGQWRLPHLLCAG